MACVGRGQGLPYAGHGAPQQSLCRTQLSPSVKLVVESLGKRI